MRTKKGGKDMQLLKVSENLGYFQLADGGYSQIDNINKEDLLRLVGHVLNEDAVEMDPYDEQTLKNQAHQVIYKSIFQKLTGLRDRRREFIDGSARLFLEEYENYKNQGASTT